jgi:putative ABC transport system permease protein
MTGTIRSALLALIRRWHRHLLTATAMTVGAGTLVSMVAIQETAARDLSATVDRLRSDVVRVTLPGDAWQMPDQALVDRAATTGAVIGGGTFVGTDAGSFTVSVRRTARAEQTRVPTVVATPEGLHARGVHMVQGRTAPDSDRSGAVLVGVGLARELGVAPEPGADAIVVNGVVSWVSGIVRDGPGEAEASSAIVVPPGMARRLRILPDQRSMRIEAAKGTADAVADRLPFAMFPGDPTSVSVGTDPSPEALRHRLLTGSRTLVLAVAAVSVFAALLGIVTTMQIAVRERRREIGIARAMGESRLAVGARFLLESTVLGVAGGVAGFALGVLVAGAVAQLQGTTFMLAAWTVVIVPASALIGAIAGSVPAWRASRVDPALLLRSD